MGLSLGALVQLGISRLCCFFPQDVYEYLFQFGCHNATIAQILDYNCDITFTQLQSVANRVLEY